MADKQGKKLEIQPCTVDRGGPVIRIIICDDDEVFLERFRNALDSVLQGMNVNAKIHTYSCAEDIGQPILVSCDIAFLDIDFVGHDRNGLDIARRLREGNSRALIFFITNFIEYAPEGYEVQAFRYILKHDLDAVLGRYLLQALERLSNVNDMLQFQHNGALLELSFDDILYLEVLGHSVSVVTEGGTYSVNATLSSFEQQLERHGFLRVHKSYLVNMRYIKKFQCRELTLSNGAVLRVSEKSYAEQKRKYLLWKGWR